VAFIKLLIAEPGVELVLEVDGDDAAAREVVRVLDGDDPRRAALPTAPQSLSPVRPAPLQEARLPDPHRPASAHSLHCRCHWQSSFSE